MTSNEECVVKTLKGPVRGKKVASVRKGFYFSFQGIPYAKPPTGNLRFKPPVEAEPWTAVRDATKPGPSAPCIDFISREYKANTSEDCLFVNVYTPELPENSSQPPRAVMFWIHGGGFSSGSGDPDFYGPDYLVPENVVLVTCNYRLGALGFLGLDTPEYPGNNGLRDIVLALKWCQKNISAFGGDPNNVTIFGESAGGAAVHYLMLTKKTEGLFHKAIAQSGVATNPWAMARKPRECAFKLGELLGCSTDDDRKLMEFLRGAKKEEIVAKSKGILRMVEPRERYVENAFVPCVEPNTEDAMIAKHPEEIYKAGEARKVPFLIGCNTLEGLIVLKPAEQIEEPKTDKDFHVLVPKNLDVKSGTKLAQELVGKIRSFYFSKGFNEVNYVNALSRIYFLNGINQTIEYHRNFSTGSTPTYVYQFTFDGNVYGLKHLRGFGHWKGTGHADELVYLFKQTLLDATFSEGTKEHATMETMTKIWTNFAKTGRPLPDKPNFWTPIGKNQSPYMEIGEVLTEKHDLEKKEFEFWQEILKTALQTQSNSKL